MAGVLTKNTQSYCIKAMLAFVGWIVLDAQPLIAYSVLTTNRDMAISVSNTTLLGSAVSVKPSPLLTYVVFVDTLSPSQAIAFIKHLSGLITARALPATTKVILASKGGLTIKSVNDAAIILSALLQSIDSAKQTLPDILSCYQMLLHALEFATEPWESYVIIANLPEPRAEQRTDTAAYLSYTCFIKRIRLSYWAFTDSPRILSDLAALTAGAELQETRIDYLPSMMTGFYEISWKMPLSDHGTATKVVSFTLEGTIRAVPTLAVAHQPPPLEVLYHAREYAQAYLGRVSSLDEESQEVTAWLDKILLTFPAEKEFLSLYLRLHKNPRDRQKLLPIARALVASEPGSAWAYLQLGKAQLATNDPQAAETSLKAARALSAPTTKAARGIERTIRVTDVPAPAVVRAPIELIEAFADVYVAQKRPDRAFAELEQALTEYPDATQLGLALAKMAESVEAMARACVALERVVARNPGALEVRTALLQMYVKQGLMEQARPHAQKALGILPDEPSVRKTYALLFEALDQPDEALLLWSGLRNLSGYLQPAAVAMSRLLAARKDFAAATAVIDAARATYPKAENLITSKADLLRQQGRHRDALNFLRADPSLADSVPVLALKAQLADVLAEGAPDAYARLLRTLKDVSRGSSELHQTVERRGALVAIRDRRQDLLPQFGVSGQRLLGAATSAQILNKTPLNTEATAPYVRVPAAIFEIGTPQTNALKAFAARPDLQRLALAVSDVPPGLLTPLLTTYKQHPFSDRTLKLLGRYGRVLETGAEGLVMPGGPPAEQVWRRFIGVAPGNQRLTLLLQPGAETKLAFLLALLSVDANAQAYLTRNLMALHSTYGLFTEFMKRAAGQEDAVERFATFLGALAIDPSRGIRLPGTLQAWPTTSTTQNGATTRSIAADSAAAGVDQSMLFLVAMMQEVSSAQSETPFETFNAALGFSRCPGQEIGADLVPVLKSNAKLLVPALDILCDFAPMTRDQIQAFFSMITDILAVRIAADRHVMFGQLWSVLEILNLARQSGSLDIASSNTLFAQAVARKPRLSIYANIAENTLDILLSLVEYSTARFRLAPGSTRQALLSLMVPVTGDRSIDELNDAVIAVAYFQKVRPIEFAIECANLVARIRNKKGNNQENVLRLRELLREIDSTNVVPAVNARGRETAKLRDAIRHDRRTEELLGDAAGYNQILSVLAATVNGALTGFVYAMYFSAEDPVIIEQPTLVQRHQFADDPHDGTVPGLATASLQNDQSGYRVVGRLQGLERIVAAIMVGPQHSSPEEVVRQIEEIAALRSPKVRFASDDQNMQCALAIALGKELLTMLAQSPELWDETKRLFQQVISQTEILAVRRATTERNFEEAFTIVGTAGLYRLGMLYEKTGAKANSDSPVLRALAALETEGSHRDLTDYDPWRARPYAPAVTAARNAGSLVLRLRELCFQHGVPASALKRIAAAAAAEVAVTGFADAQKLWADSEHFKRASAGAVRLPDPRPFAVP